MPLDSRIPPILQEYWGYERLRPLQQEAMEAVLAGQDSLVILPTGGGKSLCFQVPAMILPGTAVVVSPLISLMKDQVDALREIGVPAGKLHSGQHPGESREVLDALRTGGLKMLYAAPERLMTDGFMAMLAGMNISFLAVDEAHCVSEWGHDFRPEYRQLGEFREAFPKAALHCYTATATPRVARDIREQLGLRSPATLIGSFDRPNLSYRVDRRTSAVDQVCEIAERHPGAPGIVYCISRKETESLSSALAGRGLKSVPYHAGLDAPVRELHQQLFITDQVQVVVATIAFGMGIDKPDVRFVVHTAMPKSLENYQQESGRAGRDGLASECVLLFSGGDMNKWRFIIRDADAEQQKVIMQKLRAVEDYAESWTCRRAALLRYFGEEYPDPNCAGCDVCAGEMTPLKDSAVTAQKILSCIFRLKESYGPTYTAQVLTGSNDKRIAEAGHHELSTYGLLKDYDMATVRSWTMQLLAQGCARQESHRESPLRLTSRGWDVMRGKAVVQLVHRDPARLETGKKKAAAGTADDWAGVDQGLFEELRGLRTRLATERNVPPYVIFGDRTLRDLARRRPSSREALHLVHGIGDAKVEHYGGDLLAVIRRYHQAHPEVSLDAAVAVEPKPVRERPRTKSTTSDDRQRINALLRVGTPIDEVARQFARAPSTIEGYLVELIADQGIIDCSPWMEPELVDRIEEALAADDSGLLKPVYEALGREVPYWQLRVVARCRKNRGD